MGAYSSYYLYQKFEKRGDQDWIPCTPNVYSISGDSTIPMPLVEKSSADTECGYVPKGSDDYNYEKWEVVPNDYICDDTTKYAKERKYVSDDNVNWIPTDIYRRSSTVLALNSTDCGYDSQWDNYNCSKWEPSGTICNEGNKYERERKYFRQCEDCQDCSAEWIASNIYRQGGLITYDSVDCGYVIGERMYRWVDLDPSTDYYCSGSTKYYKQQKEVSYNQGQTWQSVSPAEYRQGKFIENSSADCETPITPIYRWYDLNPSTDYYCSGTTKYYKQQYQVSYDNGSSWENVVPAEYRWGSSAETQSTDCGYIPPQYRWYPSGTTCIGYDKWEQSVKQVSYDSGSTWENVVPTQTSATTLIEAYSEDCGFVQSCTCNWSISGQGTAWEVNKITYDRNGHYSSSNVAWGSNRGEGIIYLPNPSTIKDYPPSEYIFNCCFDPWNQTITQDYTFLSYVDESNGDNVYYIFNMSKLPSDPSAYLHFQLESCVVYDWQVATNEYICKGYDKYSELKKVQSFDGGTTWEDVIPHEYTIGTLIESDSHDCGYEPVVGAKFVAEYDNGDTYSASCTTSSTITSGETRPNNYNISNMKSVSFGECVTSIGRGAFRDSGLSGTVIIPNYITSIGYTAFNGSSRITNLTIGSGVTHIDQYAFGYCSGLESITMLRDIPPVLGAGGAFNNTNNCPIYVPCGSVNLYKNNNVWNTYSSRIYPMPYCGSSEAEYRWYPSGTTCVGYDKWEQLIRQVSYDNGSTWYNFRPITTSATTLIQENSVDCGYDPNGRFYAEYSDNTTYSAACDGGTSIGTATTWAHSTSHQFMVTAVIGKCINTIGNYAFRRCESLTSITIPNTVTTIGMEAFSACTSLSSITIPDSVTSIDMNAFRNCTSLISIDIPNSVTIIEDTAFYNCTSLTSVTIGSGVTSIDSFRHCSSLISFTILATTPPSLNGYMPFDDTNNCPIYVPSESVPIYKGANKWSDYAGRIQAIP